MSARPPLQGRGVHSAGDPRVGSLELVAKAEFQEWTASGVIRHASFTGLREDKDASEVVRERAEAAPL